MNGNLFNILKTCSQITSFFDNNSFDKDLLDFLYLERLFEFSLRII